MSAEKEIVNYWYNKKGFFTINNLKTGNNRDAGLLAIKLKDGRVEEACHVQVSCSITGSISEAAGIGKSVGKIVDEKFIDLKIQPLALEFLQESGIKNVIVLGSVPKSRKSEIIKEFSQKDVTAIEIEEILYDVFEQLDTQYYKNDILRALQLTKFLLLSEPEKLAKMLANDCFTSNSRKEFISSILDRDEIVREFRKTNADRLGTILKNSGLKPDELAGIIENNILNKKTRKLFLSSLMEQEKARKITGRQNKIRKLNVPLGKFLNA